MADTVIPPTTAEPSKPDARIGTSSDKSWAGWAISSFTNKISTANGEIEPTAAAPRADPEPPRPASVPRPAKSSPSAQLRLPKEPTRPTAHPLSRSQSDRPVPIVQEEQPFEEEGDDIFDAWGAIDDDEQDVDPLTAAVSSPKSTSPEPRTARASAVPYDDGGEPDFAGWLAAKNQAKAKHVLPKGLGKSATTNSAPTRATVVSAGAKASSTVPTKKIDTKPKEEDVDDEWGAWD